MANFVEEALYVCFYNKADFLLLDRPTECVQTLVLGAFRAVSIAAVLEYGLVDLFQNLLSRCLRRAILADRDERHVLPVI